MTSEAKGARPRVRSLWRTAGEILTIVLSISAVALVATIAYLAYSSPSPPSLSTIMIQLEYGPEAGNVPLTVSFHANVTGGEAPYSYFWTFGDGVNSTSGPDVVHTYLSQGEYAAQLTVTCLGGSLRTRSGPVPVFAS